MRKKRYSSQGHKVNLTLRNQSLQIVIWRLHKENFYDYLNGYPRNISPNSTLIRDLKKTKKQKNLLTY